MRIQQILDGLSPNDGRRPFLGALKECCRDGAYGEAIRRLQSRKNDIDYKQQIVAVAEEILAVENRYPPRVVVELAFDEFTFTGAGRDYHSAVVELLTAVNSDGHDIPELYAMLQSGYNGTNPVLSGSMALTVKGESAAH